MKIVTPEDSDPDGDPLGEEVVFFPGETAEAFHQNLLLKGACRASLEEVAILGVDAEGELFVSGNLDHAELIYLIERVKIALIG